MLLFCVHLVIIFVLSAWLWKNSRSSALASFFWLGLGLKIIAGVALGWIYVQFYAQLDPNYPHIEALFFMGDSWSYFAHGKMITQLASKDWHIYLHWLFQDDYMIYERLNRTGYNSNSRAVYMYRITHIFNFFTANNYWLMSVYFSLFSFSGLWKCADAISNLYPKTKYALVTGFLIFPSVVFWSSGILKETILMGCLGWIIWCFLKLYFINKSSKVLSTRNFSYLLISSLCFWVIFRVKYYYFAVFTPIILSYSFVYCINKKLRLKSWVQIALFLGIIPVGLISASLLHHNLNLNRVLTVIVQNYQHLHQITLPENQINFVDLSPNLKSFITHSPKAFIEGLLRPYPWEKGTLIKIPVQLENLFLYTLILCNLCLALGRKLSNLKSDLKQVTLLLISALTFIIIMLILMTFASPNVGALARYKTGIMPFIVYLLSIHPALWAEAKVRLFFSK